MGRFNRVEYFEHAWKEGSVAAYQIAFYYVLVGENDRAFEWLEKGIDERTPGSWDSRPTRSWIRSARIRATGRC